MPVVAVVNRKGGSGKSTLATHLAGYCAREGIPVMLGDVDRQQSTQTWLRLREARQPAQRAPILGWTVDPKNALRVPPGVAHVVLDTPGGLHGFELARVVMLADVIIMPVCNSVFDRESAAECHAELLRHPRVASGRCKVAAVGMRLDSRTRAAEVLRQWADQRRLPFVGVLRETQGYVKCVEQGLTLFDMPPASVEADLAQWRPILEWVSPVLRAEPRAAGAGRAALKDTARRAIERAVDEVPAEAVVVAAAEDLLQPGASGDDAFTGPAAAVPALAMGSGPATRPGADRPAAAAAGSAKPAPRGRGAARLQQPGLLARIGRWLDSWRVPKPLQHR